jgi:hypothetical protein
MGAGVRSVTVDQIRLRHPGDVRMLSNTAMARGVRALRKVAAYAPRRWVSFATYATYQRHSSNGPREPRRSSYAVPSGLGLAGVETRETEHGAIRGNAARGLLIRWQSTLFPRSARRGPTSGRSTRTRTRRMQPPRRAAPSSTTIAWNPRLNMQPGPFVGGAFGDPSAWAQPIVPAASRYYPTHARRQHAIRAEGRRT